MVKLSMVAKIPLPPEGVMGIMTDPENVRVFRNVKVRGEVMTAELTEQEAPSRL